MISGVANQAIRLRLWTIVLSAAVFFVLPVWALFSEHAASPIWQLIPFGTGGGALALGITCIVRARSKRVMVVGDVIRIVCWTLFGYAYGSGVNAYFYFIFPQYAPFARGAQGLVAMVALLTIVLSMFAWPPGPKPKPGCCANCGYSLCELTVARCPECGTPFDPAALNRPQEGHREDGGSERPALHD